MKRFGSAASPWLPQSRSRPRHRNVLFGLCFGLLSAAGFALPAAADESAPAQSLQIRTGADIDPCDRQTNAAAKQADAWFENYKFRDGVCRCQPALGQRRGCSGESSKRPPFRPWLEGVQFGLGVPQPQLTQ